MHKSGVRPAVRVIRLEAVDPTGALPSARPVSEASEPEWSSLPAVYWPEPIGSVGARARADAAAPDEDEGWLPPPARASAGKIPRLPDGAVTSWPLRFQASPMAFARLWWFNCLLTVLTGGLYLPWARVQCRRYLMRRTKVAGHVLDYHEPPARVAPRYALALALLAGVASAWSGGSVVAGMLALSLALAVWPLLVYLSLSHRLAHISWAHRRLVFDASHQASYRALWLPLASAGALAWLAMAATVWRHPGNWLAWGVAAVLWVLALPGFVWTWYLFRQRHLRLGPMHLVWKAPRPAVTMLLLRTLVWAMLASVFSAGLFAVSLAAVLAWRGRLSLGGQGALALAAVLLVCAAVQPYAQARLQNLLWNKSGNRYLRFRSKLSISGFVWLQCKHAFLLLATAGLYWPWAVVASRRMRTQALTVWSRVDADVLKAHWPPHDAS